jgi:serine/threonine protein kinase
MRLNGNKPAPTLGPGYEPIELLSRGNAFDVYDAWSYERGCRVIVKTVRDEYFGDVGKEMRLMREGRLLLRLTHPHIVRAYEMRNDGRSRPLLVMETLGGQTVAHMVQTDGTVDDRDAAQLGLQVGSAIRYLHLNDHLHLDLKPSNVIAEAGRAKLIDLGLAEPPGPVSAGVGTWCYLSPEQARGESAGPEADVWGLGALLYEALAGFAPFDDPDREIDGLMDEDLEFPQLERRPRSLAETSGAGPSIRKLVHACLEPETHRRPSLLTVLGELEGMASTPAPERRWVRHAF